MNAKQFVDTNILMYAHDAAAGIKHDRAKSLLEQLWISETGVISTQVLQELCVNLGRRTARKPDWKIARDIVKDYLRWEVVVNTGESVLDALDIQQRYGVSFWDALVIQAAEKSGAEVLYSEDLANGQSYGSVRVVNPFK